MKLRKDLNQLILLGTYFKLYEMQLTIAVIGDASSAAFDLSSNY